MRVLLQTGLPYTMDIPCTKRFSAIANELKSRGHEAIVLAPEVPQIEHQEGIAYYKAPLLKKKTVVNRLLNEGISAISSCIVGNRIPNIDIVLTSCPPALVNFTGACIAKKHNAMLIYDVRDIWPDVALEMGSFSKGSVYDRTFACIRDYLLKQADLITTVSNGKVVKLKSYAPNKKVVCIPNGFNTDYLNEDIDIKLFDSLRARGNTICTYTGNIGLAQGIDQLIFIAEKSKAEGLSITFLVYGTGAEEKKLRKYIDEHNLANLSFEGVLPNKKLRTVHEASDISFVCLVNANLKDSIPTKMYEALGVGCPVFLVAEGDSATILREIGYGVDVSPCNKEQIWESFKKMYSNLSEIKRKRDPVIKLVKEQYSLIRSSKLIVDEMERMYKSR